MHRAVRGMNDLLPNEIQSWHYFEKSFTSHVELYNFHEVRTPLIEHTALFKHEIGENTDVVEKEMYAFERHGDFLAVRPEGTAGTARAYVEHSIGSKEPITRWYYLGPMFRGERPAKGRYRQFHQAGCELFGDSGPLCDVEMIDLVYQFFLKMGISKMNIHVNSIGSGHTRQRYRQALVDYFTPIRHELSEDSQRRLELNPLRILDSKNVRDQELSSQAPNILDLLEEDDKNHWQLLVHFLKKLNLPFVIDTKLVRGLDYYTRTLFEFRVLDTDLGAQNTLCGGGRYDKMISNLGGPETPAIGFAMGIERILQVMKKVEYKENPLCYFAPLDSSAQAKTLELARKLRDLGLRVEVDGRGGKLKSMLKRADAQKAKWCIMIGETEMEKEIVSLKNMKTHDQEEISWKNLPTYLANQSKMDHGQAACLE